MRGRIAGDTVRKVTVGHIMRALQAICKYFGFTLRVMETHMT